MHDRKGRGKEIFRKNGDKGEECKMSEHPPLTAKVIGQPSTGPFVHSLMSSTGVSMASHEQP